MVKKKTNLAPIQQQKTIWQNFEKLKLVTFLKANRQRVVHCDNTFAPEMQFDNLYHFFLIIYYFYSLAVIDSYFCANVKSKLFWFTPMLLSLYKNKEELYLLSVSSVVSPIPYHPSSIS